MLAGAWLPTAQAIIFDTTGTLIDGWHRTEALLVADSKQPGIVVPFYITEGVQRWAVDALDTGKKRSLAELLRATGVANSNTILSGVKLWSKVFGPRAGVELSEVEQRAIYEENRKAWDTAAGLAVKAHTTDGVKGISKAVVCGVVAEQLMRQLNTAGRKLVVQAWTVYAERPTKPARAFALAKDLGVHSMAVGNSKKSTDKLGPVKQTMLAMRMVNAISTKSEDDSEKLLRFPRGTLTLVKLRDTGETNVLIPSR